MSNLGNVSTKQKSGSCQECNNLECGEYNKLKKNRASNLLNLPEIKKHFLNQELSLEEAELARQLCSEGLLKSTRAEFNTKSNQDVFVDSTASTNSTNKKKIIPNLAALKTRPNNPIRKGLAFKEMEQKLIYKSTSPSRLEASLQPSSSTNKNEASSQSQLETTRNNKRVPGKLYKGLSYLKHTPISTTNRLGGSSSSESMYFASIVDKTERKKTRNFDKSIVVPPQSLVSEPHFSRLTNTPNTTGSFKLINE